MENINSLNFDFKYRFLYQRFTDKKRNKSLKKRTSYDVLGSIVPTYVLV